MQLRWKTIQLAVTLNSVLQTSTDNQVRSAALSGNGVRIRRLPDELELYFPPLRNVGAAAGFGLFGALSVALPVAAIAGAGLTSTPGVQSWLAVILVAGFALPVMVLGFMFLALSVYLPANSLMVRAGTDRILTTRRVFGMVVSVRAVPCAEIAVLQPQRPRQFQSQFSAETRYRLIARNRDPKRAGLVVAESLVGRAALEQVAEIIAQASRVEVQKD